MRPPTLRRRAQSGRGFTLIEMVFSMVILLVAGVGAIAAIIYTRQSMELDKQRIAALNYCRQAIEAASTLADVEPGVKQLVPFNAPGLEIQANVEVQYLPINSDGTIYWATPLAARPPDQPVFCRVTVTWESTGSWTRPHRVSMCTIIRAGTT